jgi:hypothetical protein
MQFRIASALTTRHEAFVPPAVVSPESRYCRSVVTLQ